MRGRETKEDRQEKPSPDVSLKGMEKLNSGLKYRNQQLKEQVHSLPCICLHQRSYQDRFCHPPVSPRLFLGVFLHAALEIWDNPDCNGTKGECAGL